MNQTHRVKRAQARKLSMHRHTASSINWSLAWEYRRKPVPFIVYQKRALELTLKFTTNWSMLASKGKVNDC